jgi:hypothetical protein
METYWLLLGLWLLVQKWGAYRVLSRAYVYAFVENSPVDGNVKQLEGSSRSPACNVTGSLEA